MKKFSFVFVLALVLFGVASVASATVLPPTPDVPTEVSQCKKGGWQNYNGLFKNQGDCVSFVATGGKNEPAGPAAE